MAYSDPTQTKLELIEWIATLDRSDWVEQLWQLKQALQTEAEAPASRPQERTQRGYGKFAGQIWMSEDFDAPLEDFKEYM